MSDLKEARDKKTEQAERKAEGRSVDDAELAGIVGGPPGESPPGILLRHADSPHPSS